MSENFFGIVIDFPNQSETVKIRELSLDSLKDRKISTCRNVVSISSSYKEGIQKIFNDAKTRFCGADVYFFSEIEKFRTIFHVLSCHGIDRD